MKVNFNVTNQKDVPALRSGIVLPPAGQKGRIFYDATGNGMYIDDGTNWLPINSGGGGGVGTLQQVTDLGNQTDNDIIIDGQNLFFVDGAFSKNIGGNNLGLQDGNQTFSLPDVGGILVRSVNGNTCGADGNVELTSVVVPTLQQCTDAGNVTNDNIRLSGSVLAFETLGSAKSISGAPLAGLTGDQVFNLPDAAGTLLTKVNGQAANTNGDVKQLYRTALTEIGESVNVLPATTRPVQRLIYRGVANFSGITTISLGGITVGAVFSIYGSFTTSLIDGILRTVPLNYSNTVYDFGDFIYTNIGLNLKGGTNQIELRAFQTSTASFDNNPIEGQYLIVFEFQPS